MPDSRLGAWNTPDWETCICALAIHVFLVSPKSKVPVKRPLRFAGRQRFLTAPSPSGTDRGAGSKFFDTRCGPVSGPGHPCRAQVSVYRENSPGDLRSAAGAWSGDHAPTGREWQKNVADLLSPVCDRVERLRQA